MKALDVLAMPKLDPHIAGSIWVGSQRKRKAATESMFVDTTGEMERMLDPMTAAARTEKPFQNRNNPRLRTLTAAGTRGAVLLWRH
jgi:hypothetical protein